MATLAERLRVVVQQSNKQALFLYAIRHFMVLLLGEALAIMIYSLICLPPLREEVIEVVALLVSAAQKVPSPSVGQRHSFLLM